MVRDTPSLMKKGRLRGCSERILLEHVLYRCMRRRSLPANRQRLRLGVPGVICERQAPDRFTCPFRQLGSEMANTAQNGAGEKQIQRRFPPGQRSYPASQIEVQEEHAIGIPVLKSSYWIRQRIVGHDHKRR